MNETYKDVAYNWDIYELVDCLLYLDILDAMEAEAHEEKGKD